jgi:hypothetical protein
MSEDFVKHFTVEGSTSILPDAAYWLSREELILTYLHQRNANVPKVSIKNLTQKSIAMENVGQSLSIQLKENKNHFNTVQVAILITNSIEALIEIFNLGILHLDIALRNIATPQGANNRIYILDFVHCLSATNRLQKPLPLLPTDGLHHPMLYQALKKDWNNYFFSINQTQPVLDQTLTLSNEEFSEYWSDSISVQNLSNQLAILCHGIGNLLEEASWLPSASDAHKSIYREQSKKLKNLSEDEAQGAGNMRCAYLRIFCAYFRFSGICAYLRIFAHILRIFWGFRKNLSTYSCTFGLVDKVRQGFFKVGFTKKVTQKTTRTKVGQFFFLNEDIFVNSIIC